MFLKILKILIVRNYSLLTKALIVIGVNHNYSFTYDLQT